MRSQFPLIGLREKLRKMFTIVTDFLFDSVEVQNSHNAGFVWFCFWEFRCLLPRFLLMLQLFQPEVKLFLMNFGFRMVLVLM